jgi:hypothetical protein
VIRQREGNQQQDHRRHDDDDNASGDGGDRHEYWIASPVRVLLV